MLKLQAEFTDMLVLGRNYLTSCGVLWQDTAEEEPSEQAMWRSSKKRSYSGRRENPAIAFWSKLTGRKCQITSQVHRYGKINAVKPELCGSTGFLPKR